MNIDYIEININKIGLVIEILIDVKNNLLTINNKTKEISNEKIYDLLRIIRNWNNYYKKSNLIDNEKFIIKIISQGLTNSFIGDGTYPDNYIEFKNWVGEINE